MPLFKKLAVLATAAEAARRYAKSNPEKAGKYLDQAADFVNKQTKGKYAGQIKDVSQKAKDVAGIHEPPAPPAPPVTPPAAPAPPVPPTPPAAPRPPQNQA